METRHKDRKLKSIADRLVRQREQLEPIRSAGVEYVVLMSDQAKTSNRKIVFADCAKVPDKDRWIKKWDFEITVYEPNITEYNFDQHQIEILLEHELMHIGVDMTGEEPKLYVVPHDVEDFWHILDTYGRDWQVINNEA